MLSFYWHGGGISYESGYTFVDLYFPCSKKYVPDILCTVWALMPFYPRHSQTEILSHFQLKFCGVVHNMTIHHFDKNTRCNFKVKVISNQP